MDIEALLEAFQDFEKKGKKETCPILEQFLCHVAKTGQPVILWSQFKAYLMFKLEKVIDDFHASAPEQRGPHNPNVEYIPFEEMKKRLLKIVDGYNGIPFTIQRLCELLTDPKRNYSGTDKFLRGLEKNIMVVSCIYPTSEKNGASSVNRMNGVMFPGNSPLYSDRNVNGPGTTKPLSRPKLSLSTSLSTNGLPECPVSKEPEEVEEEQQKSASSLSEGEVQPNIGTKNKCPEEEDSDVKQDVKRLKLDKKEDGHTASEKEESSCNKEPENLSESSECSKVSTGQDYKEGIPSVSDSHEHSSAPTEPSEGERDCSTLPAHSVKNSSTVDQSEQPSQTETKTSFEQDSGESSSSDEESLTSNKQVLSSSNSPDLSTEGGADISNSSETAVEPVEHD
ncbi:serine/threonine-protein phosphatase 4 regulatory subunit 2-like isoform 2-T2 [Pholidichthys leucotaenia]